MAKSAVLHIQAVDPEEEWRSGVLGWIARLRVIIPFALFDAGGGSWLLAQNHIRLGMSILSVGGAIAVCLIVYRHFRYQRTVIDRHFHDFCHHVRDDAAKVFGSGSLTTGAPALFDSFSQRVAQNVAEFYRELMRDPTITCTVRMGVVRDDGETEYVTVGRSTGLNPSRATNTVPIAADEGLPAKLRSAKFQGVFLIPCIDAAIAAKDYLETPNDSLPDCRSMIVCAINGWESSEKVMVGILSVASAKLNAFDKWHTTPLKGFADILGLVYPMFLARLVDKRRVSVSTTLPGPHNSPRARGGAKR